MDGLTPTERKILRLLANGARHAKSEVRDYLYDELGPVTNIWFHISNLRKKLRPLGQDIVCEVEGRAHFYRHIILLKPIKA